MIGHTKQKTYEYRAFGLNITSDIMLDGLLPASGPAEVRIVEGKVPVTFPGPPDQNSYWGEPNEAFAFRVYGVGSFMIRQGTEIIVEKDENADSDAYILFILGTCMGALLMQRGMVPIHGSALSLENQEVIITGHSGAGKSTLTAFLNQMGFFFLADDIAALQMGENGEAWIMPAFPRQKLWRDTAVHLYGSMDHLERIPGIRDKYHVNTADRFITTPKKLRALFEISTHSKPVVEVEEIRGAEKVGVILQNTYRLEMVDVLDIRARHFQQCSKMASQIHVFKLRRPETGYTVEEQVRAMLSVLKNI